VVQYKYDAWGKPISKTGSMASTLGTVQPFRYRGYIYDEETGLYYLGRRYYNTLSCRFVNADTLIKSNVYAYCENSPVLLFDSTGRECEKCAQGVALTADRYVLNEAQSKVFSQWLSSTYPREELQPLIVEIANSVAPGLIDTGVGKIVEPAVAEQIVAKIPIAACSKFTAKALALGNKVHSIGSPLYSLGSDIYDPIKLHPGKTGKNIKEFYQGIRSDYGSYGCVIDVFGGSTEVVLSISVYTNAGCFTETWKDECIWDAVSMKSLGSVASFLEDTFVPINHGHPAMWVTYNEYGW